MTITCPKCNSKNWRCWDEVNEIFTNDDDPNEWTKLPVGYLVCKDCKHTWTDHIWEGWTWVGRNVREAFGWED